MKNPSHSVIRTNVVSVVFYTPRDYLKTTAWLPFRLVSFMIAWCIQYFSKNKYCHVQVFYGDLTVVYSPFALHTCVCEGMYNWRPFTVAYHLHEPLFTEHGLCYTVKPTAIWRNFVDPTHAINCVSEADTILHNHFTRLTDECIQHIINRRSTGALEESIRLGIYGGYIYEAGLPHLCKDD